MSNSTCPYKGLEPFTEADAEIFFGRDKECKRLVDYLKSCRLTVLYGWRGVGKTSLLQAGVTHELRQLAQENIKNFGVPKLAVIIFDDWQSDNPLEILIKQIRKEIEKLIFPKLCPKISIDSHSFDEILLAYSQCLDIGTDAGIIFIIFDKFEDYFLYHSQPQTAKKNFQSEFPTAVKSMVANVNFLIAIDGKYLAKLDSFKVAIPDIIRNRQELLPLDEEALYETIVNPIFNKYNSEHPEGKIGIAPDLVEEVIKEVNFDTTCLQLLMQCLWEEEQKNKSDILRLETLQNLGQRQEIIKHYFQKRIDKLVETANPKAEQLVAKFVGYLITPGGTKIVYPVQDLAKQAGVGENEIQPLLNALEEQNLINPVSCPTNTSQICYEISHEILAPAILDWHNNYWQEYNKKKLEVERELDTAVVTAPKQFAETCQLDALQTIVGAGEKLKQAIQEDLLPAEYPTDSLQEVIEQILENIQEIKKFSGHQGAVCSVIFTPDSEKLVSGAEDGTIRLWKRQGKLLKTFADHRNWIWNIDISPDGRYLASACDDGTARLWDLSLPDNPPIIFPQNLASVRSLAFSPEGKLVAIAGVNGTVRLCDLAGKEQLQISAALIPIWCVSFSPQGDYFATASDDGTISFWDLKGKKLRDDLKAHESTIWSLNFNQQGTMLVSGSSDKTIKLWDLTTGEKAKTIRGHKSWVFSVRFHPHLPYLASASEDCTVRLWDFAGNELAKLVHAAPVQGINFNPTGEWLASACGDRKIHLWDLSKLFEIKIQQGVLLSVSFSHDGKYLATSAADGTVCRWDVPAWEETAEPMQTIKAHKTWVKQVSFSPKEYLFATAAADGTAYLWDIEGNRCRSFVGHENSVWSINFSPDGQLIATGSADKTIRIWNLQGEQQYQWDGAEGPIWSVSFSADGKFLASGADDGSVRLWTLQGQKLEEFTTGKSPILSVSFSADGQFLAGSSSAGKIYIWDWQQGKLVKEFTHDPAIPLWSICFSPDSRYIVSGSFDRNAYLWDLEKGKISKNCRGHQGPVRGVSFSPDGKFFVTVSSDGTIRKWLTTLEEFDSLLAKGQAWLKSADDA